jgi:dihydroorotate dehydrogenase (fumarate)
MFTSLANMTGQLIEAGANGLVLFNRFYQPDLDIEAMEVRPALELSTWTELRLPLRWIAILSGRGSTTVRCSPASIAGQEGPGDDGADQPAELAGIDAPDGHGHRSGRRRG